MDAFEKIAEEKIREAMARGEFDRISGAGKPLEGLEAYFSTPENVRVGYSVLKSAGVAPEEIMVRKEIYQLRQRLEAATDPAIRDKLAAEIRGLELKYEVLMDYYRRARR
jgi:hypothetical protein